jgi:penicillin-binding protein 1C
MVTIRLLLISAGVFAAFLFYDWIDPVDLSAANKTSRVVKAEDGSWLYAQTNREEKWRFPVEVKRLDPGYVRMLLAFEDQRFYRHIGVDPLAMMRAISQMIVHQKIVSGGSTITMQLARLLEPKRRTLWAKMREILCAFQLEWHYSKEKILAAYLTLTPYGGNVEGVVAASMHYFGKLPAALSAAESALLVSLPQSPERNRPDKSIEKATEARNKVLKIAKEKGVISRTIYEQALVLTPPRITQSYPRYAPHLSQKLLSRTPQSDKEIKTTLDSSLQQQLEQWARSKSDMLGKGTTLAVLVVRNRDASIEAYLGSHDMFSSQVSGYVDMIQALRSPGSTLKPFIYALGFEKHLIHPNTLILDRETRFGDYMPHNFSHQYSGEVTVAYALQHSLNIPAVKILRKVGAREFVERISHCAGKVKTPKNSATLPIALGGIGITMFQITQLYVTLANGGKSKQIHYLPKIRKGSAFLYCCDQKAAKMTTSILRRIPAPEGFIDSRKQIAYKTGTSYGYRDAWTFAYDRTHTVGVWVGKPDNSTQLKRTGRKTAAPLALEVLALLESLGPRQIWEWPDSYLGNSVPSGLAHFDPRESLRADKRLTMLYPRDNARFKSADCSDTVVEVKVEDGKMPYYWYIDGEPRAIKRSSTLLTFKYGAHIITVIDDNGERITRTIWVDKPEC